MDQLTNIVTLTGGIVATILLPLLGFFQFYDSKKRKEAANAKKAEADNITSYASEWKENYNEKKKEVENLNQKIDQLYAEKQEDRFRIHELMNENTQLKLHTQALEFLKCNNALKCIDRDPPNDFVKEATTINKKEEKQ